MKVLVTGGTGFIGRRMVRAILERGSLQDSAGNQREVSEVCVTDIVTVPDALPEDSRLTFVEGDFSLPGAAEQLVDANTGVVFHLAAVVSGQAEQEFDLGIRINLDGTRRLLEACRALDSPPRFVFASSVAVYGGDMPPVILDSTSLNPQTSYGSQKAASEMLINDFSRRGYVDGRSLRLPTVVVRAGKANAAASSFASAVIREPLQGDRYTCPVDGETDMWILSPRRVVDAFLHAEALPADRFATNRSLALPGITVSVAESLDSLRKIAGDGVADRVEFRSDPFIEKIVAGWATRFEPERALAMGFEADSGIDEIIEQFVEDDLGGRIAI